MQLVLVNLDRLSSFKQLLSEMAGMPNEVKTLVLNICKYLDKSIELHAVNSSTDKIILFIKRLSKQPGVHTIFVEANVHAAGMRYIKAINTEHAKNDKKSEDYRSKVKNTLLLIQQVMKMIVNLHEGVSSDVKMQDRITSKVLEQREIFSQTDALLDDKQFHGDGELAVIIVNVLICFNAVAHNCDQSQIRKWLIDFSGRFAQAASIGDSSTR
jgi:hypothetical protein